MSLTLFISFQFHQMIHFMAITPEYNEYLLSHSPLTGFKYITVHELLQYSEISLSTVVYSSLLQYYFLICLFKACYLRESQVIVYTSMLLKPNEFIKKHYSMNFVERIWKYCTVPVMYFLDQH